MNAHHRTTLFIAVIFGLISQVHGQLPESQLTGGSPPGGASVHWRILDVNGKSNPPINARRPKVSMQLRDPATAYRKSKAPHASTRKQPEVQPKVQIQRAEPTAPAEKPSARQPEISRPAYQVGQPQSLVTPRVIRLVQAEESGSSDIEDLLNDLDDLVKEDDTNSEEGFDKLLDQAKDLLGADESTMTPSQSEPPGEDLLDGLNLPSLDGPERDVEDSQDPQKGRDRLKEELDKLLDDEGGISEEDPLGLQEPDEAKDAMSLKIQEVKEKALIESLVDPKPDAIYRQPT